MRIFLAGATGVLGSRLVPLLVRRGHVVAGMTRDPAKAGFLREFNAVPVICNVFDAAAVRDAIATFEPRLIIDQVTDLPDDLARLDEHRAAQNRIRREGVRNLADAAGDVAAGLLSQSIAWTLHGDAGAAVEEHERIVIDAGGVIVRYGQLYGPGTFYQNDRPSPPRVHVYDAARRTLDNLEAPAGSIITLVE